MRRPSKIDTNVDGPVLDASGLGRSKETTVHVTETLPQGHEEPYWVRSEEMSWVKAPLESGRMRTRVGSLRRPSCLVRTSIS